MSERCAMTVLNSDRFAGGLSRVRVVPFLLQGFAALISHNEDLNSLNSRANDKSLEGVQPATNQLCELIHRPMPHGSPPGVMPRAAHLGRRLWVGRHRQASRLGHLLRVCSVVDESRSSLAARCVSFYQTVCCLSLLKVRSCRLPHHVCEFA